MSDYIVTVCSVCRTASCWHGEFMCDKAAGADVIDVLASQLLTEGREHPSNYAVERLNEVCGRVRYVAAMERGR
jgi:hypothetical protein